MIPLLIRTQPETCLTIPEIRLFSTDFKKGQSGKNQLSRENGNDGQNFQQIAILQITENFYRLDSARFFSDKLSKPHSQN